MKKFLLKCSSLAGALSAVFCLVIPVKGQNQIFTVSPETAYNIEGRMGNYIKAVQNNWLFKAPENNPAILDMFKERDIQPYKHYMPWSGEFAGKYLTGATLILRLTGDIELKAYLNNFVRDLISLQDPEDGYLGPFRKTDRLSGWDSVAGNYTWEQWNHNHIITGLLLWLEATDDKQALQAAIRIGDMMCDKFLKSPMIRTSYRYSTDMNHSLLFGMARLYRITGNERYLELARAIIKEFEQYDLDHEMAGDYVRQGVAGSEFYLTPRPRWESLITLIGICEMYYVTGNDDFKKTVQNFWWSILKTDRHNNGGFSTSEGAVGNPYDGGAIETCATVAWVALSVEVLKMTGNSVIADELELSTLNQVMGYQSEEGLWVTYNTPMDGKRLPGYKTEVAFQCRPGSEEINCCSAYAPTGFGQLAEWALMNDQEGLVLNWYGPSNITSEFNKTKIEIIQHTSYPATGDLHININPEKPFDFSIKLRIPYWSDKTTVSVNGSAVPYVYSGQYLVLNRKWKKGDLIVVKLDMSLRFWKGERNYVGKSSIYRGPLLMVLEDRYPAIHFSDPTSWKKVENLMMSNKEGASMTSTFTGTKVSIEGKRSDSSGIAKVEIDGKFIGYINQYRNHNDNEFIWTKSGLTNEPHTIKITILNDNDSASSGRWINIDKVRVGHEVQKTEDYRQGDSYLQLRQHSIRLDALTLNDEAVLVKYPAGKHQVVLHIGEGKDSIRLIDYATAGAEGKWYSSWLTVENNNHVPFSKENPGRTD